MVAEPDTALARRGPLGRLAAAIIAATLAGLTQALGPDPTISALPVAGLFAVVWGATRAVAHGRRMRALGRLTPEQRHAVLAAVDSGSMPADATLALAVRVRANQVRAANLARPLLYMLALPAVQLGFIVVAAATREPAVSVLQGLVLGMWQQGLRKGKRRDRERALNSALFADRRARALLGMPPKTAVWEEPDARWRRSLLGLAVVASLAFVGILVGHPHHSANVITAAELRAAGYRAMATRDGTTVWFRIDSTYHLRMETTGAAGDACSLPLGKPGRLGYLIASPTPVCTRDHDGPIVAYLVDSTYRRMAVHLDNGSVVSQTHRIDLRRVLPNEFVFVVTVPSGRLAQDVEWD